MKLTRKQKDDIDCILYFVPRCFHGIRITDTDKQKFLEYSEKGMNKELVGDYTIDGFNALVQGKKWRGIHINMYEQGILDGSVPYFSLLGGDSYTIRKWYEFWKPQRVYNNILPVVVVNYLARELFQGIDAKLILEVYVSIVSTSRKYGRA
jgi:hypothetical protein